jgi:glutamate formiminotransferase
MRLMQCVPNVSEGRDAEKVARILDAVREAPGVTLLDYLSDSDHNRTVITYLGDPQRVLEATIALCERAFSEIDMTEHRGGHPRMGAVDVAPFIPLGDLTTEEAVTYAQALGEAVGAMGVPVYFYEDAASSPERRNLADVRRGEYEGLPKKLGSPGWGPDCGPSSFNPRSGATAVGVRFPLIAFNVNLGTPDVALARRIADAVRGARGGYRHVKAMGLALEDKGQVQVSMNLVNYRETPIHRVVETIRDEASRHGVEVTGCELVGLAPLGAFEASLQHYLQMHEFTVDQIIETHLLS